MQGTDPFEYFRGISSPFSISNYVRLHTFSKKITAGPHEIEKKCLNQSELCQNQHFERGFTPTFLTFRMGVVSTLIKFLGPWGRCMYCFEVSLMLLQNILFCVFTVCWT